MATKSGKYITRKLQMTVLTNRHKTPNQTYANPVQGDAWDR